MNADYAVNAVQEMLLLGAMLAAPILGAGLVVGLFVAVFQAATQIQETTLNFVPKLAATALVLALLGPWCLDRLVGFAHAVLEEIAYLGPGMQSGMQ